MQYRLKDLVVDIPGRSVRRGGEEIRLPDLSFDAFKKLIDAAPETVSLDEFRRDVWFADHVSSETIAQRIALLRKALDDRRGQPEYIRTVRGTGYALVGDVRQVEKTHARYWGRPLAAAIFAALVTTSLVIGLVLGVGEGNDRDGAEGTTEVVPKTGKSTATILVERAREQLSLHQSLETDRAIALLREAVSQEPGHFDARMALASALTTKTTKFGGSEAEEQEAEALARQLIGEQPSNSNAWSLLAYTLGSQGRMDESSSAYEYAYQLDPGNAMAMSSAAHNLLIQGELQQAYALEMRAKQAGGTNKYAEIQIAQIFELIGHPSAAEWRERALQLNPGQVVVLSEVARMHLRQGNPEAAITILKRAEGADQAAPQILQLRGRAELMLGRAGEAQSLFEAAGEWGHKDLVALRTSRGDIKAGAAFLDEHTLGKMADETWPGSHIHMAEIAAAIGQNDRAIAYLSQAVNLGWRDINWLMQSPYLVELVTTPEGQAVISRIERELELQRKLIDGML